MIVNPVYLQFRIPLLILCTLLLISGCKKNAPNPPPAETIGIKVQPPSPIKFHDAAQSVGIKFRLGHKSLDHLTILDVMGHGCAFLDYDGDGKLDILLVGYDHCVLYRNLGNGNFEDVTDKAFPGAPRLPKLLSCAVADYDDDGNPDIFVSGYGRNILYHNEGNGTFRDVTAGSGLEAKSPDEWNTSAAWADLEGNGRLDLYLCRYVLFNKHELQLCHYSTLDGKDILTACGPVNYKPQKGSFYRNLGNGHFKDVTKESGLGSAHGYALACMFCDFNNDGKTDLYVANDQLQGDLFLNIGKGKFKNIAVESGVAYNANGSVPAGMGVDWGDYDGDGRFDLLVTDFIAQPKSIFHNDGNTFSQMSYPSGLGAASVRLLTFGGVFIDTGNTGMLDVIMTNGHVEPQVELIERGQTYAEPTLLLKNTDGHFEDISALAGPDFARKIVGRGVAIGDYDGDGRQDILIVDDEGAPLLLHNDSATVNHWLNLRCLRRVNGSIAVGARITISTGGKKQIAEVRASGSYLSTNAPDVHFGIGANTVVDTIDIRWPDLKVTHLSAAVADRSYTITPNTTSFTSISAK